MKYFPDKTLEILWKYSFRIATFIVGLVGLVITMWKNGISLELISIFLLILLVLFLIGYIAYQLLKKEEIKNEVLIFHLILPTDGIKPFYNTLIESISKCLESISLYSWFLCPRIPSSSFDELDIWQKYESISEVRRATGGVILVADNPDANFERIVESLDNYNFPIVMFDVYFNLQQYDELNQARMPYFVGGNEIQGGALAAQLAQTALLEKQLAVKQSIPQILILLGGNTAWELQRISSFKSEITANINCEIHESNYLYYSRSNAYDNVYQFFLNLPEAECLKVNCIFAANDDMAMGARNALRDLTRIKEQIFNISVIGYDGSEEVKDLIDRGDQYIYGTVDVKVTEQCRKAVNLMKNIIEHRKVDTKITLIEPRIYVAATTST